ncbi:biotin-dependent carboxyltransferase family protein [Pelagibacterium lacus]|uniref:Allophanate hydrolase subunit 2 family protein n=1 Tax=Pelagibacterium lacus TaxID=2282655 RepID=A0A369W246_9HYPH|nr:biotin-dependent carboxyltransferase family protein [Pelagibacterium lacus]RDE08618.1 allophanate hydrolase subunit 2 family protein [Pelagibacterium lacus]
MNRIDIVRASPMTSIQDAGRPGFLGHGISASGPMDRQGYAMAGAITEMPCGAGLELGPLGLDLVHRGAPLVAGLAGGAFAARLNGEAISWPARVILQDGGRLSVTGGPAGNYAYLRFAAEIDVPVVLGSRATNLGVALGGLEGRALAAGDTLALAPLASGPVEALPPPGTPDDAPFRIVWGLHAAIFPPAIRAGFLTSPFAISPGMDRMGVRLADPAGVFTAGVALDLVSDAVVPGDIQIIGDGTPVVLMRDHQPTGGYPRIGTIIASDLDRFAQMRPGAPVRFVPVTVEHAHKIARSAG